MHRSPPWNSIKSQLSTKEYRQRVLSQPHRLKRTSSMESKRCDPNPNSNPKQSDHTLRQTITFLSLKTFILGSLETERCSLIHHEINSKCQYLRGQSRNFRANTTCRTLSLYVSESYFNSSTDNRK